MPKSGVQINNSGSFATGSPLTVTLGFPDTITAGNAVFVLIHQTSSSTRTYTVTGSVNGTTGWVRHLRYSGSGGPEIWCHPNHPGGAETFAVTHGSASADFHARGFEVSGMGGTVTMVESSIYVDGAVATTHYCADSPGLSTASDVIGIYSAGAMSTAWTDSAVTGIWSEIAGTNWISMAYTVQASGVTDERGQFTSSGTARIARGAMAFFTGLSLPAPTVTDVDPAVDVPAGGETVTITGTNFVATPAVTFGGTAATGETWISATEMTAVVPAHAEGLVTVRVTNPDAQYD
jgi:hypothetical protein